VQTLVGWVVKVFKRKIKKKFSFALEVGDYYFFLKKNKTKGKTEKFGRVSFVGPLENLEDFILGRIGFVCLWKSLGAFFY